MQNPISWFEIYVDDMDRARKFYETVFQVKLQKIGPALDQEGVEMWAFPSDESVYGASGSLVRFPNAKAGGNSTMVYFYSEDCAIEEGRVIGAGGKIHRSKISIGEFGFITLAMDTEGNLFGIHSM